MEQRRDQRPRHGGDLAGATLRFGTPTDGWLDLSTGINPHPYPFTETASETLARLPDTAAHDRLLITARSCYGVSPTAGLTATPGSEIAIRLLPYVALPKVPKRVAIVGRTYGSHHEAWRAAGAVVEEVPTLDAAAEADVVVLCNPNNPDGRTIARRELAVIAAALAARGRLLVVDEAFADLDPDNSLVTDLDETPAVVLRSFGKFYGLAGLRLGFAAGPHDLVGRLRARLGDWPVSGPALDIGQRALADTKWQDNMRAQLAHDCAALVALLTAHGLTPMGGTSLFQLIEHNDAEGLHERLARRGILTRLFPATQRLRIGLPAGEAARQRLSAAFAGSV